MAALLVVAAPIGSAAAPDAFVAQLHIRDGYVAVDPDPARTVLGATLASTLQTLCPSLTPDRVRSELIAYLDRLLRTRGTVLAQQLTEPSDLAAVRERDPEAARLAHANGAWSDMDAPFQKWAEANRARVKSPEGLLPIYKTLLADGRLADGPLIPALRNADDIDEIRPWFPKGQVPFSLAAPITRDYQRVRPNANADEWSDVREDLAATILDGLACRLWYRDEIVTRVSDYLEMRGIAVADFRTEHDVDTLVPKVGLRPAPKDRVGIAPEKPHFVNGRPARLRVIMSPDPLLEGILIDVPSHDLATIRRVLYLVLPSDAYRAAVADLGRHLCLLTMAADAASRPMILLKLRGPDAVTGTRRVYVTRRFLAERLRALETLGFTATPTLFDERPEPPNRGRVKTAHLLIAPAQGSGDTGEGARLESQPVIGPCGERRPGEPSAAAPLRFDRGQDTVRPETFANESSRKDSMSRRQIPEPERPNQFRLGVEHEATRPLRYTLGYARGALTGPDALSGQIGFQEEFSGDVQYSRDFVFFDALNRRLQVSARAFSDFTPDRRLPSGTVDERRTGAEAGARLDLWRDLSGQSVQLDVRASWRESRAERDDGREHRTTLTLLDLGLLYVRDWDGTASSRRLDVQPLLTLGYSDDRDRAFLRAGVDARTHQFVGAFIQWESRVRAVAAAGSLPDVERPSFGGEDSVRGYRPDAGLARAVWVLQNELWLPMRLRLGLPAAIETILRRNFALALLGDVGGLHDSQDAFSGVKGAVGIGVRFVWQDLLTFRLDYAHAVGDRTRTEPGGLVYFTVTTRPSL